MASLAPLSDGLRRPTSVTLWHASTLSSTMRDFRLVKCAKLPECTYPGLLSFLVAFALFFWTSLTPFVACTGLNPVIWYSEELQEALPGSGKYLATKSAPIYGWTGFLVELVWEYRYLVSTSLRRGALTRVS